MNNFFDDVDADLNHYGTPDIDIESNNPQVFSSDTFNRFVASNIGNKDNALSIVHHNIRSLTKNYDGFMVDLEMLDLTFDVICLSETWMKGNALDIYFPNYVPFHQMRCSRRGGGVAIYVKNSLISKTRPELNICTENSELVSAEIIHRNKRVIICTAYRPPSGNKQEFENEIVARLSMIDPNVDVNFLVGDVNMDLMQVNSNNEIAKFYDSIISCGLIPTIFQPTHIFTSQNSDQTSGSIIDNIFSSSANYLKSGILNFNVTDHLPIFILFDNFFTPCFTTEKIRYRVINYSTIAKFSETFSKINLYQIISPHHDSDTAIKLLDGTIFKIFNDCCPIKSKTIKQKDKNSPWIRPVLRRMIRRKHMLYNQMRQGTIESGFYNHFRNSLTTSIRRAKADYHKNLFGSIKHNIKKHGKL